jgi:hypothetical protein
VEARSYLDELKEKVALIPVAVGESAAPLSLPDSGAVDVRDPSATKESFLPAPRGLQSSSAGESARVSVGEDDFQIPVGTSRETLKPASSTSPETAAPVIQTELEQEVASLTSIVSSIPPSFDFSSNKVMRVGSREEVFTFTPVALATLPPLGSLSPATSIRIPAIDLVSSVEPLGLLDDRGYWLFSITKGVVRQVSTTGNPGEGSRGWYMGHKSDVFERLPEVVDLILEGKTVDIILETEKEAYLYRVSDRPVILPASEFDSGYFHANLYAAVPEIVLTTCVPPRKWDYRLLVTARLVGMGSNAGG